jgi:hypothetical protein
MILRHSASWADAASGSASATQDATAGSKLMRMIGLHKRERGSCYHKIRSLLAIIAKHPPKESERFLAGAGQAVRKPATFRDVLLWQNIPECP